MAIWNWLMEKLSFPKEEEEAVSITPSQTHDISPEESLEEIVVTNIKKKKIKIEACKLLIEGQIIETDFSNGKAIYHAENYIDENGISYEKSKIKGIHLTLEDKISGRLAVEVVGFYESKSKSNHAKVKPIEQEIIVPDAEKLFGKALVVTLDENLKQEIHLNQYEGKSGPRFKIEPIVVSGLERYREYFIAGQERKAIILRADKNILVVRPHLKSDDYSRGQRISFTVTGHDMFGVPVGEKDGIEIHLRGYNKYKKDLEVGKTYGGKVVDLHANLLGVFPDEYIDKVKYALTRVVQNTKFKKNNTILSQVRANISGSNKVLFYVSAREHNFNESDYIIWEGDEVQDIQIDPIIQDGILTGYKHTIQVNESILDTLFANHLKLREVMNDPSDNFSNDYGITYVELQENKVILYSKPFGDVSGTSMNFSNFRSVEVKQAWQKLQKIYSLVSPLLEKHEN